MPLAHRGRPLKRWTWIGAFGDGVAVCAARAWVGGVPASWWSVDVEGEAGRAGAGGVQIARDGVLRLRRRGVAAELALGPGAPVEVVSPHGRAYAWTRKAGGVDARGWVEVGGRRRAVELRGIVDESAGYHARHTAWRWSAGVGTAASGAAVAWNLVAGVHDAPEASERTVWVDGVAHEVGPVAFGDDGVGARDESEGARDESEGAPGGGVGARAGDGSWAVRCAPAAATHRHRRNALLVRSDLEQRVGPFTGSLPVAGELREAWGVLERHDAHW
jgi:hypothetical protein